MSFPKEIDPTCERLFAKYRRETKNAGLAEEIVEYAASTYLCRYPEANPNVMFTIAHNHFLNLKKKDRRMRFIPSDDLERVPSRANADILRGIGESLETLPLPQRQVLELRYLAKRGKRQVAESLGCSVSTVKRLEGRAVERLRAILNASDLLGHFDG